MANKTMDEATASNIIRWYEGLEEEVVEFLRYVPPQNQNMNVWSPRLATVIVEACGLIDSLFRYISPAKVTIHGKKKKRDKLNILDYAELHSSNLQLPAQKIILLISPPSYRNPFGIWSKQGSRSFKTPSWWTINNDLKHQRIDNFCKATMDMAIDALAGALLIISKVPELLPATLRHGWLDLGGLNPEHLLETLQKGREGRTLETSLFALWLGYWELPKDIKDFSPLRYHGSKRLLSFFGKF